MLDMNLSQIKIIENYFTYFFQHYQLIHFFDTIPEYYDELDFFDECLKFD